MTLRLSILIILICLSRMTHAQKTIVETVDIHNYWQAFDSVQNNKDYNKQLGFIKHLYIDRGTPGLKAFIQTRGYTDSLWLSNILKYPKFWASIRSTTLTMETRAKTLESYILKFKELYPQLKPAAIYFTIGGLNSGGTTLANQVLIGAEMISGSAATDVSEFDNEWLKGVFAKPDLSGIVTLNLHEYVHTQQRGDAHNVLGQSLKEGLCDFITELCIEKPLETAYLNFGRKHADSIRKAFTNDMFSTGFSRWLYNGFNQRTQADLGYYVGYEISKAYYQNAKNKGQAICELIEVNYSDEAAVEQLLQKSGYITEAYNRGALLKNYQKQQPFVTELSPFKNDT
ncbi:hypothetical protein ACJVDH_19605 [Pedobacter sp. AW1-32]|uniref:hypothetical protein n=1 Tax=Pedobacter sp. AW1-32 TaxID=3383026 RepID=UPI003FEF96B2